MEQAFLSRDLTGKERVIRQQPKRQILPPGYVSTQDPTNTFGEFKNLTSTEVQYLRAGNKPYFQMTDQEKLNFKNTGVVPKIGRGNDTPTRTPVLEQTPMQPVGQQVPMQFVGGQAVPISATVGQQVFANLPPEVITFNNDQRAFQEKLNQDSDLTAIRNSIEPLQKSLNEKTQKLVSRIQGMNLPKDLLEIFYAGLSTYQARQPETQKLRQIGANYDQVVKSKYGAEQEKFNKRRQELFIKYPPQQKPLNLEELKRQQELFRKAQERAVSNLTKAPTPIQPVQQDPIVDPKKEPKPSGPKRLTPIQPVQQDPIVDPIRPTLSAPPPPPTFTPDPALEAPKPITPIVPKPKGPIVDPMKEPYKPPTAITPIVPKPIQPTVDPMRPTITVPKKGLMKAQGRI
jgi:hypothetical protein